MDSTPSGSGEPGPSSTPQANGSVPTNPPSKSQKSMTKAERRELQEKQRAEKTARAAENPPASKGGSNQVGPSAPRRSGRTGTESAAPPRSAAQAGPSRALRDLKEGTAAHDDLAKRAHGLRIFSHFGLTKSVSGKGDIHPAVVRLALLFSSFTISGANARCMATLTAFKTVSLLSTELYGDLLN